MMNSINSLKTGERVLSEREMFVWPNSVMSNYQGAGAILFSIPNASVELTCDNANVGRIKRYGEVPFVLEDASRFFPVYVYGRRGGNDFTIEADNVTVRALIRKDGRIVGYALICFWGRSGNASHPFFSNGEVVKAVCLEYDQSLTEEQANARLDEAYEELVIKAGLFDTVNDIGLQWNDWCERNVDWYWNEFYPKGEEG